VASAKGVFPSAQVLVTLTVLDINDYKPTFSHSQYTATLSSCSLPGNWLTMDQSVISVTDLDQVHVVVVIVVVVVVFLTCKEIHSYITRRISKQITALRSGLAVERWTLQSWV